MSERYGPWVVVGEPTARALLVQHVDEPARRGRLRLRPRLAQLTPPWQSDPLAQLAPWPAGVVEVIERADDYYVLADADELGVDEVLADAGQLELDEVMVLVLGAIGSLEQLHALTGEALRTFHVDKLVLGAAGDVRLLPPLPPAPRTALAYDGVPSAVECMAPEVVRALDPGELSVRADVYSVACVAHRVLSGAWPHVGDTILATLSNIVEGHITRPLRELRPGLPPGLVEVLESALSVEPGRRPPSCTALAERLRAHLPFDPARGRAQLARRFADATGRAQTIPAPPPPPRPAAPAPPPPTEQAGPLELPRALEPWREALELFAPELALSVGDVVRRVARLFGPLSLDADVQRGDPDGYRGVARRGPLERLLLSEWAVALEHPEEFLRRVAMGEQLYTALAHKEPGGLRRSIVLFDAGPRSLGAPRVVQLALLIVLAARARAAGVRFTWGVLQDERRALVAELNAQSIRRLLGGRALRELGGVDATEWSVVLGEPQESDDLWLVGPPGLDAQISLGGGGRVVLEDSDDPDQRVVQVEVRGARGPARALELPLPPEDDVLRLLREPFVRRVRAPRAPVTGQRAPLSSLVFESGGRWVVEQLGTREVVATFVPRSTRETAPAPVRLVAPDGELLVAASVWRNRLYTLQTRGLGFVLQRSGRHGGEAGVWTLDGELPPQEPLDALAIVGARGPERVYLRTRDGGLYAGALGAIRRDPAPCGGLVQVRGDAAVYSTLRDQTWSVRAEGVGFDHARDLGRWPEDSTGSLVVAVAGVSDGVAIQRGPTSYVYVGARSPLPEAPPEATVVSVAYRGGLPHLVVLDADRRTLRLLGTSGGHAFYTAPAEIVRVAPNPKHELLAYVDVRGALRGLGLDGVVVFERA